ncbi:RHS repeat-associated protein [Pseudomonas lini]|uniref:RHS repeat-associated core domain-containing protein n=1 Tax=Pseudomonas lini TaxID=163011 RepID=UPI0027828A5A|nr:RHS repeat-associated core domain-containing protein [Pseudomonas lini]MDQ0126957.1 RHS repeat-associated protein [Pseudomonas lini]
MPAPRLTQGLVRSPAAAFSRVLLLAPDQQQTILAELDRTGPNRLAYTPYGFQSGLLAAQSRLGFNGQLNERPTGWYHLGNGHRVYNPVLMRFHSPDRLSPFGKGGVNAYAYCGGSPINRVDPSGQWWVAAIGQFVSVGVGMLFATAATVRTAVAKYVTKTPLPRPLQVANTLSFWGGVVAVGFRPAGIPGALTSTAPALTQGMAIGGNAVSQILTFGGGLTTTVSQVNQIVAISRNGGPSLFRMALESVQEVSGLNAVTGPVRRLLTRASDVVPNVPLESVRVVSSEIRNPGASASQQTTRL